MFSKTVGTVTSLSREKLAARLEFFKRTLGCSESEVSIAVSKMPQILGLSDASLLRNEFLVNEAAMAPQYIVQRPVLLTFSLEKRLVPQHHVMKILQEKYPDPCKDCGFAQWLDSKFPEMVTRNMNYLVDCVETRDIRVMAHQTPGGAP